MSRRGPINVPTIRPAIEAHMSNPGYYEDARAFCGRCGAPTARVRERVVGHDGRTGKPHRQAFRSCPNRRWWWPFGHIHEWTVEW